jgi:hypothetical protein
MKQMLPISREAISHSTAERRRCCLTNSELKFRSLAMARNMCEGSATCQYAIVDVVLHRGFSHSTTCTQQDSRRGFN